VAPQLRVGASMTIAECRLPVWLAQLRRGAPRARVEVRVLNSMQVMDQVQDGALQLGFVETPRLPLGLNAMVVHQDELVVVVAPDHPWSQRRSKVSLMELARTSLVVRESGSGTREALDELLADLASVQPAQVLHSNAAVRVAVAAGHEAPAALSRLAVRHELATGELLQVPLDRRVSRPLTAVWPGPRRLSGQAAQLVALAREATV
jgi:DNA-binding transcriptional LysR family regulator